MRHCPAPRSSWRSLALRTALCLVWSFGAAAEARPAERAVELPSVEVRDSRTYPEPEAWRYGAIPGFEILANAPTAEIRRLLRDFQLFRQALNQVWQMPERPAQPALLILCGTRAAFERFLPLRPDACVELARFRLARAQKAQVGP